jgi:arylsulfatase A-like enzyme
MTDVPPACAAHDHPPVEKERIMKCVWAGLSLGAGILTAVSAPAAGQTAAQKPNFLIFIADDAGWNDIGAYGNPAVQTPNIDRLAREGMRFDKAWLTCSSCSPSRAGILTGRYPHSTGCGELHLPWPEDAVLMSTPLRGAGYWAASVGKWHPWGDAGRVQYDFVEDSVPSGCELWLDALKNRPKDKPFFLWCAAHDAHRPFMPKTFDPPNSPDKVIVPPYLPDGPETRGELAMYYDEISRMDTGIGKVLAELQREGILDTTFILFLSDNGSPFPRCKTRVYDSGVRTPFIVRYPKLVRPGSHTASLVSSVDIAPTILALAGLPPLPGFQGKSFLPLFSNPSATIRKYAYAEHNWHALAACERAVRSDRFNYIHNWRPDLSAVPPAGAIEKSAVWTVMKKLYDEGKLPPEQSACFAVPQPVEELYDTQTDPFELHNLAGDPEYAPVLEQMRNAMEKWQKDTKDEFDPMKITSDSFSRETGEKLPESPWPHPGAKPEKFKYPVQMKKFERSTTRIFVPEPSSEKRPRDSGCGR